MDATTNQVGEITKTQDGEITKAKVGETTKAKAGTNRGTYDMLADYVAGDIIHHKTYGSGTVVAGLKGSGFVTFGVVTPTSPQIGSWQRGGENKFAHIYVKLDKINPDAIPLPNPEYPDTLRLVCNVDKAVLNSSGWRTNLTGSERPGDITKA